MADDADVPHSPVERRKREALRALVDEMLMQIRAAASAPGSWTEEARAQAEADLARIMENVRRETLADRRRE